MECVLKCDSKKVCVSECVLECVLKCVCKKVCVSECVLECVLKCVCKKNVFQNVFWNEFARAFQKRGMCFRM